MAFYCSKNIEKCIDISKNVKNNQPEETAKFLPASTELPHFES